MMNLICRHAADSMAKNNPSLPLDRGRLSATPHSLTALGMIKSVDISNFRGFQRLSISDLALVNIIVGDNAVGKTALLEALFLALSGNAEKPLSLRQWRGLSSTFQTGSGDSLVEGIYADLFHDPNSTDPITITLTGSGFENRQLVVSKTRGDVLVPTKSVEPQGNRHARRAAQAQKRQLQTAQLGQSVVAPISLTWTDESGHQHITRVTISPSGLHFEGTGEKLPNCFMYAAQIPVPPNESADHYSALMKRRETELFRRVFRSVFDQVSDISVGTEGGSSVLLADVPWAKQLLPLGVLSGGTNRVASILLALAYRKDGAVLVDEIDSGVYHARQDQFAKALLEMARSYKSQLIMTTHSEEWLEKFSSQLSETSDDVAFWRLERRKGEEPTMRRFSVADFASGMLAGEMR
jgi:hypothetical protein